jgi:spore protease
VLAVEIRALALKMCKKRIDAQFSVLVVGLGNREMSPDAIGAETVRQLSVTRHLQSGERISLTSPALCEIAAIAPGVTGQTGMEAQELVRGLVEVLRPDLVVAVDALVARAPERLAATVQLSDAGIAPGSGIGARRRALCAESVGAPVLALGVPTVVDCATLVSDALTAAGFGVFSEEIEKRVQTGRNFLVSPREVDLLARRAGLLLAESLEKAFSFA